MKSDPAALALAPATDSFKTIALIERKALIRECLARCIGAEIGYPVAAFADADDWRRQRDRVQPSVVILGELGWRSESENEAVQEFVKGERDVPVVILSSGAGVDRIAESFRWGAKGVIPLDTTIAIVVEAIRLTLAGGVFIPPVLISSEPKRPAEGTAAADLPEIDFTAREKVVLRALLRGKSNKLIASDLRVSESTVKVHIHSVMRKLQVTNRTEAAIKIGKLSPQILGDDIATPAA